MIKEADKPLSKNEGLKEESNYLRGTIVEGLLDTSTGSISDADTQLTKFHGIYQQDDRDVRSERRKQKLEKAYSFSHFHLALYCVTSRSRIFIRFARRALYRNQSETTSVSLSYLMRL